MMYHDRWGQPVTFYWPTETVDRRGNRVMRPTGEHVTLPCSASFDRSNRAEVPGQQEVLQITLRVAPHAMAPLWTVAFYKDTWWDVAAPPAERDGPPSVRHLTVTLRARPDEPTF